MAISVVLKTPSAPEEVSFSVVGNSELNGLWKPIFAEHGLSYLDYCAGAGLRIDRDNFGEVVSEIRVLLTELSQRFEYSCDITNPVFRCSRLLNLLETNPPESGTTIYIG